jgi:hypothetical protein
LVLVASTVYIPAEEAAGTKAEAVDAKRAKRARIRAIIMVVFVLYIYYTIMEKTNNCRQVVTFFLHTGNLKRKPSVRFTIPNNRTTSV